MQKGARKQDETNKTLSVVVVLVSFMCRVGFVWTIVVHHRQPEEGKKWRGMERKRNNKSKSERKTCQAKQTNRIRINTLEGKHDEQHGVPALCH